MKQTVFYVWQSWDRSKTRGVVRNAIDHAISSKVLTAVGVEESERPTMDEDARDSFGAAVEIHRRILERIRAASAVIVDVTNVSSRKRDRLAPNPNVMFELGWALAELGWERVILVANEDHGKGQMPFDIRNKMTHYFSIKNAASRSQAARDLGKRIAPAIAQAVNKPRSMGLEVETTMEIGSIEISMSADVMPLGLIVANRESPASPPISATLVYWYEDGRQQPSVPISRLIEIQEPPEPGYALQSDVENHPPIMGLSQAALKLRFRRLGGLWRAGCALIVTGGPQELLYQVDVEALSYAKRHELHGITELVQYSVSVSPSPRPRVYIEKQPYN